MKKLTISLLSFILVNAPNLLAHPRTKENPAPSTLNPALRFQIVRLFNNNAQELRDTINAMNVPDELRVQMLERASNWIPPISLNDTVNDATNSQR